MAHSDGNKLLEQLASKVEQLVAQYKKLRQSYAEMQAQYGLALERIAALEGEGKALRADYANLKIAKTMELSYDDQRAAHRRLSSLVREVDECIALLKKESLDEA